MCIVPSQTLKPGYGPGCRPSLWKWLQKKNEKEKRY